MNKCHLNTELSSLEETRSEFNRSTGAIKLGIDVHQEFYVVVMQVSGSNPKPPQRFEKEAFGGIGRPSSRPKEEKCTRCTKRAGLVLGCSVS